MKRRWGVFGSAGSLLVSAFVAVMTIGDSPAQAIIPPDAWTAISAGDAHSCGVKTDGHLYCWGSDSSGKLGDGDDPTEATRPRTIGTFQDWVSPAAGGGHTCGVRKNGKLYCWGWDEFGEIGDGLPFADKNVPTRVGTFEDWSSVTAGQNHSCGIRHGGKLYCWGWDFDGEIGDGGPNEGAILSPKRVGSFEDWATVSAGQRHTCGIRKNGKLYCWGEDEHGAVGDGGSASSTPVTTPKRIGSFEDWSKVAAGSFHSCGVRKNGKLYCWGTDQSGQIGDGGSATTVSVTSPKRIGSFEDWSKVTAGQMHSCGIRHGGKLYCWGLDDSGEVGNGDPTAPAVTAPVRIGTFEDWTSAIAAGGIHTCGVRRNSKGYCWGGDGNGQIGDGDPNVSPITSPKHID